MTNRGWILRNEIIWNKPNCMPSSVNDRFTVDFEKIFFFVKNKRYYFEQILEDIQQTTRDRVKYPRYREDSKGINKQYSIHNTEYNNDYEKGRNKRCIWTISTSSFHDAHFATYPPKLIETPIKAGCKENGIVLDPFMGSGTTAIVAKKLNRNYIGIELNEEYIKIADSRIQREIGLFNV